MKKTLAILCALCLLLSSFSVALAEDKTTLRMTWWGGESRHAATVEALKIFNEKSDKYVVEAEYGASGYDDKLLTMLAGNQAPDVCQLSYANIQAYAANKQVVALDDYIASGALDISKFDQSIIDMYKVDGVTYALPTGINTTVLLYNKDLFDAAGIAYPDGTWDMEKYYEVARQLIADTDGDGEIDQWGCGNPYTDKTEITFLRELYNKGGHLWSAEGKIDIEKDLGTAILEEMVALVEEGMFPDPELTASNPSGVYDFSLGRVAMCLTAASSVSSFTSTTEYKVGVCPAPACSEKYAYWLQPSQLWIVSKDTVDVDGAVELLNFICNDMDAGLALGTQRGIPANSDIRAKVGENLDEIMKQSYAAVDATIANTGDVIPEMYPANGMEFISELTNQYELLIYGMTTPAEALQASIDHVEKMMSE